MNADGGSCAKVIDTTPGRMKIAALLPHHPADRPPAGGKER